MRLVVSICTVLALSIATLPSAEARAEAPDSRAEARVLFEQGIELAKVERWAEALDAFQRSSELVARPSTSYNIANALYRLDRPVDAVAELDAHDRMPEVTMSVAAQSRSRELRGLVRAAIAEVAVEVSPASATVFVDGSPTALDGGARLLLLNPGTHVLQVARDGYHPQRREIRLERGARESVRVKLEPIAVAAAAGEPLEESVGLVTVASTTETAAAEDDRKPFVKRPGFWVLIGVVGAAAIGAGVAVAVTRKNDSPSCGTTGDCATTQGLTVAF